MENYEILPKPENPELELAWRGLCISVEMAGTPKEEALKMLQEWACSSTVEHLALNQNVVGAAPTEPSNLQF